MARKPTVLITGCSDGGIGSALAIVFAKHNYQVFATARNTTSMSSLQHSANITLLTLDVLQPTHIQAAVAAVKKETGGTLDILVNNAGATRFMPLLDENIEEAKKLYDVNVWAPLEVTRAFMPLLMESKGLVVFIASLSGHVNIPWQGVYAATKSSIEILADTLRVELSPFHVRVQSVVTGAVDTNVLSAHSAEWKMPIDSLYASVESEFNKRTQGQDGAPRWSTTKYAEGVIPKMIASKTSPKFRWGPGAQIAKFFIGWLPISWLDALFIKGTGIDTLLKALKNSVEGMVTSIHVQLHAIQTTAC